MRRINLSIDFSHRDKLNCCDKLNSGEKLNRRDELSRFAAARRRHARTRLFATALCLPLALCLPFAVEAQSGRRTPPRPPVVETSSPTVNAEPSVSPADAPRPRTHSGPKFPCLVGADIDGKASPHSNVIFANFIKHLDASSVVAVTSLGNVKREQAAKRAAGETESYVVVLQFEPDSVQDGTIVFNSPDIVVKYFVYAPGASEAKTKGKIYYQAIGGARARKDRWPQGSPIKITPEAAGIEIAERVLDWLTLNTEKKPGR